MRVVILMKFLTSCKIHPRSIWSYHLGWKMVENANLISKLSGERPRIENHRNYDPAPRIYEKGAPVHMKEFFRGTILNM